MAGLYDPINVRALNDGRSYKLLEPLTFDYVNVPEGFVTDFASVPKIFWNIFPPNGRYRNAAIIHDYMYVKAMGGVKKKADQMFLRCMKLLKVPFWKRQLMYYAVRIGGRGNYGR